MRAKIQRYFEFVLSGAVIGTRSCGFGCRLCGFQQLWHEDPQAGSGKTARRQDGKSEDFAVKNKAEATTCIKMAEYHASLGTSAKKFQQTRVFENEVHYFRLAVRRTGNRCGEDR